MRIKRTIVWRPTSIGIVILGISIVFLSYGKYVYGTFGLLLVVFGEVRQIPIRSTK